jgi:flagellar basal-body rod protein FlgC
MSSTLMQIFGVAGSAMNAQAIRLNVTASNLANADSVASSAASAYKARHPVFATALSDAMGDPSSEGASAGIKVLGIVESGLAAAKRYQPEHPMADSTGYVYGSNVNPVEELTNMISASRSYQSNVEMMGNVRDLFMKTLAMGH